MYPRSVGHCFAEQGLSIRDWFAGQALSALVRQFAEPADAAGNAVGLAEDAYRLADAMLAERAKGGGR